MKRVLLAAAVAALSTGASAQLTFNMGATDQAVVGLYNPTGTTSVQTGGKLNSLITAPVAGTLTATFLGYEALDTDTYTFNMGAYGTINNKTATADVTTIAGAIGAGALNFAFADLFSGTTVINGAVPGMYTSYLIFGTGLGGAFTPYTKGGAYDLVLGFNDGLQVDGDYDDLIVGLRLTPIPEPETYALLLAGLGAVGFVARRRQKRTQA